MEQRIKKLQTKLQMGRKIWDLFQPTIIPLSNNNIANRIVANFCEA